MTLGSAESVRSSCLLPSSLPTRFLAFDGRPRAGANPRPRGLRRGKDLARAPHHLRNEDYSSNFYLILHFWNLILPNKRQRACIWKAWNLMSSLQVFPWLRSATRSGPPSRSSSTNIARALPIKSHIGSVSKCEYVVNTRYVPIPVLLAREQAVCSNTSFDYWLRKRSNRN